MTYDEWVAWSNQALLSEWIDGEVLAFMPPTKSHQRVVVFLIALLEYYVELKNLGVVLAAPFEMRLQSVGTSREPDVLFVATEHLDRLSEERLDGPADAVFEVISESTAINDRR